MSAVIYVVVIAILILCGLMEWGNRNDKREERRFMAALRKQHREKIDQPGWTKQNWQHDAGDVDKQKAARENKINDFAAAKMASLEDQV